MGVIYKVQEEGLSSSIDISINGYMRKEGHLINNALCLVTKGVECNHTAKHKLTGNCKLRGVDSESGKYSSSPSLVPVQYVTSSSTWIGSHIMDNIDYVNVNIIYGHIPLLICFGLDNNVCMRTVYGE